MQHLRGKNDLVGFFLKNGNEGKMKVLIRAFMKILLNLFSFKKDRARFFVKFHCVPIFITLIYEVDLAKWPC